MKHPLPKTTPIKRVSILFIVPRIGTIQRGVERFAFDLIKNLDKKNFSISVIGDVNTFPTSVKFQPVKYFPREKLFWVEKLPKPLSYLLKLLSLGNASDIEAFSISFLNKFKNYQYDIVIPLGGTWTYRLGIKLGGYIINIGQSGLVKNWIKYSNCFVALTQHDYNQCKTSCEIKTELIPNGIDINKFKIGTNKSNIITCIAALVEDKRHYLLLDAFLLLPDDTQLILIGSGPLENQIRNHKAFLTNRVTLKAVSFDEIPDILEKSSVFTLPSENEAFGIVFIEAMASGLPVVAHDGPRQRYVLNEYGLFCNTTNKIEYANALKKALTAGRNTDSKEFVRRNYRWKVITEKYEHLFINILQ